MLITVQGQDRRKIGVIGILASITAFNKSRSTLMIQLSNKTDYSIEQKMIGKIMNSRNIYGNDFSSKMEKGIDKLLRESATDICDDKLFNECCESLLVKKNNMLDIACVSQKATFEDEAISNFESIKALLDNAQKVYEYVYVLLPNNEELINKVMEIANFNIYCVPQNQGSNKALYTIKKKDFLVVTDFESGSMFNMNYIKKMYNIFTAYTVPHDIKYKDAFMTDNAYEFIRKNIDNAKNDDHYSFSSSLNALVAKLTFSAPKEEESEGTQKLPKNLNESEVSEETLEDIDYDDLPKVEVNKSLFGKRKVTVNQKSEKGHKSTTKTKAETSAKSTPAVDITPVTTDTSELESKFEKPVFERNNIKASDIQEIKSNILETVFGSDVPVMIKQIRESLIGSVLYALCLEKKIMPDQVTVIDFAVYVKKINCKSLQKKFRKAPEAEMEAMAYSMAASNAQALVIKELPTIATKLMATGTELLTDL